MRVTRSHLAILLPILFCTLACKAGSVARVVTVAAVAAVRVAAVVAVASNTGRPRRAPAEDRRDDRPVDDARREAAGAVARANGAGCTELEPEASDVAAPRVVVCGARVFVQDEQGRWRISE